ILTIIKQYVNTKDALIAIDAPLIVPNEEGRREAERVVGLLFRKYNAGAHPSNRKRLSQWSGTIRGEVLTKYLVQQGFDHNPYIKQYEQVRKVFEVYPHPSMVVLFNLQKILQYKTKPNRDKKTQQKEFQRYLDLLAALKEAKPSVNISSELLSTNITKLTPKKQKEFEDVIDAVFCGYIAYYCWSHPEKYAVLGSMEQGYIATPIFDHMKQQLKEIKQQQTLSQFKN
ncbi:MAG: DUF429 domain-containing protein, partial [Nanoarchaeota archaeon]